MTKYEELCNSVSIGRNVQTEYIEDCRAFASSLISNFVKYLECSEKQIDFVPVNEAPNPEAQLSINDAMQLVDDSFFHIRARLTLGDPDKCPSRIFLPFQFKKINNHFLIKLENEESEFKIHESNTEDFTAFFDYVFLEIKEFYEFGFERFINESGEKKIGFVKEELN